MAGYPDDLLSPPPRRGGAGRLLLVALLAFALGGGAIGWLAWRDNAGIAPWGIRPAPPAAAPPPPAEARVAALEARLARLEVQASAAAANAGRAEALLTAAAARRAAERGQPLGYLEDQLRLRFGEALPGAVQTVITASHNPVTVSGLGATLAGLAPAVTAPAAGAGGWDRMKAELSNLFTIRHDRADITAPAVRLERARQNLAEGRIDRAIAEVQQLPGSAAAQGWIASARRYAQLEQALDQLETNALTEPRQLKDGAGHPLPVPSALPAPAAT